MRIVRERFEKVAQEYDAKIHALIEERSRMKAELRDARNELDALLVAEVEGTRTKETSAQISKVSKRISDIEMEVALVEKRIDIVRSKKEQALSELYSELEREFDEITDKASATIKRESSELLKQRIETLLKLKRLHDIGDEARKASRDLESIAQTLGITFTKRFELPTLNLVGQHNGVDGHLLILPDEAGRAYQAGVIFPFVQWYEVSGGEILENNEAMRRLKQNGQR